MNDLKPGDTREYKAGGETLVLEPIPYGRLKKVLKFVMEAIADISKNKDMEKDELGRLMPNMLMDHAAKILPLLFDPKRHTFLSEEWMEDNMTIPLVMDVMKSAIVINGLTDFFGKLKAVREVPLSEVDQAQTTTTL